MSNFQGLIKKLATLLNSPLKVFSSSNPDEISLNVSVKVKQDTYKEMQDYADRAGISLSELITAQLRAGFLIGKHSGKETSIVFYKPADMKEEEAVFYMPPELCHGLPFKEEKDLTLISNDDTIVSNQKKKPSLSIVKED